MPTQIRPFTPENGFQPFVLEITTPEQAAFLFALFNFVPIGRQAFNHNFSPDNNNDIKKIYPAVRDQYQDIHSWLSAHWRHE